MDKNVSRPQPPCCYSFAVYDSQLKSQASFAGWPQLDRQSLARSNTAFWRIIVRICRLRNCLSRSTSRRLFQGKKNRPVTAYATELREAPGHEPELPESVWGSPAWTGEEIAGRERNLLR